MNTTIRTLSAVVAAVLMNLGFSRSAEHLDPLTHDSCPVLSSEIEIAIACAPCGTLDDPMDVA